VTEREMTADVGVEDFTDELTDEALDRVREEGRHCNPCSCQFCN
jgi:hypothetical protein